MMSLPDFNYKQSIFYFPSGDKSKMRFRVDNIIIEDEEGKIVQQHSCHRQMNWIRREPRTKRDINNLLLDIGYTYLFHFIEAMTAIYGFDVYCGVYHTFFYQRKSLICDLVEPFRCIVDVTLRKAHNLKQIDENDFFLKNGRYQLEYKKQSKYTGIFMKSILKYKEDIFLYIQTYYRWFMKNKPADAFPVFQIYGE